MDPRVLPRLALVLGLVQALALCAGCARAPARVEPRPGAAGLGAGALPVPGQAPAPGLAAAARRLDDPDFAVRARAMRTLVAAGEPALAVLGVPGAPGGGLGPVAGRARAVIAEVLRDVADPRLAALTDSPSAAVRSGAAAELGRRGRWGSIAVLIERLDDPDPGVREAAVAALRRLTGRHQGFDPLAPPAARRTATTRWREWWQRVGRAAPAADAPSPCAPDPSPPRVPEAPPAPAGSL